MLPRVCGAEPLALSRNRTYSTRFSRPKSIHQRGTESTEFGVMFVKALSSASSTSAALVRAAPPYDEFAALTCLAVPWRVEARLNKIYWTLVQQVPSRAILRHPN